MLGSERHDVILKTCAAVRNQEALGTPQGMKQAESHTKYFFICQIVLLCWYSVWSLTSVNLTIEAIVEQSAF